MSKLAAAVSALTEQLEFCESRLNALTAKIDALEARLVKADATSADEVGNLALIRDEATIALAEYRRQLNDVAFELEDGGVTSAMRTEHRAAVDAVDRAASWIERSGETRGREIYAAIGAGRKALIRLAAMREHRPVPMPLQIADELSGYINVATDVHTEDRFRWEGVGNAEFLLDRPEFGKSVLVEVIPVGKLLGYLQITLIQRTDRNLKEIDSDTLSIPKTVYHEMVPPTVTHLCIAGEAPWRARVIQFDELPPIDDVVTGRDEACFRHTLGAKTVTMQGMGGGRATFVADCDCTDTCNEYRHSAFISIGLNGSGDFREDVTLPATNRVLYMNMEPGSFWSITVLNPDYVVDEVRGFIRTCDTKTRDRINDAIDALAANGPSLGRPTVDTLAHTNMANLKELRPGTVRILFSFDPYRSAILLVAGDKRGEWSRWYKDAIPLAEERYKTYLADRAEEEEEGT